MAPQPGPSTPVRRNENLALAFRRSSPPPTPANRPPVDCRRRRLPVSNHGRPEGRRSAGAHARLPRRRHQAGHLRGGRVCGRIRAQPAQSRFCGLAPRPCRKNFSPSRGGEVFFKNLQDLLGRPTRPILPTCSRSTSCASAGFRRPLQPGRPRRAAGRSVRRSPRRSGAFAARRRDLSGVALPPEAVRRARPIRWSRHSGSPPRLAVCWR